MELLVRVQLTKTFVQSKEQQDWLTAMIRYPKFFLVDTKTDSMVELKQVDRGSSMKVMNWEIYKSFFENNKISPSFVHANYTYDVVDEDTRKIIGPMGTVSEVY